MKIEVGSTWVNKNDLDNTVTIDTVGAFAVTGHSDKDGLYMAQISDFLHYFEPMPESSCKSLRELSEQEFESIIDEAFEEGYVEGYNQHEYEMHQVMSERELDLKAQAYEYGYDSGRNQWQDEYGFTVPDNTVQSLKKAAYAKGLKEGKEFNKDDQNLNYRVGYNDGWHDCEASFELGNEFTDSIQEQAYDEGYDQAIDDLIEAGVIEEEEYSDEDCSEECYSEYEFGDVEDDEEEYCFSKELDKILNSPFVVDTKSDGVERKHSHYFKDVRHLDYVDVYQVCKLFPVEDDSGAITHARKKLLVAGGRGAGKDMIKDITEARDTLNRYLQIEGVE